MTELKPCHACGEKPELIEDLKFESHKYWCLIKHFDTDHAVWVDAEAETAEKAKALAIEKWNKRYE